MTRFGLIADRERTRCLTHGLTILLVGGIDESRIYHTSQETT